jgi:two-component system sensor histidine kinase/response regulator
VLSNLVGNAVRHGNVTMSITVRLVASDPDVEISVHNGGHIPEDLIPRLFQPFQSGVGRRTRAEGLGLGLYIVQQIVIAHGGEVHVSSSPAEGTTFRIRLPRHG